MRPAVARFCILEATVMVRLLRTTPLPRHAITKQRMTPYACCAMYRAVSPCQTVTNILEKAVLVVNAKKNRIDALEVSTAVRPAAGSVAVAYDYCRSRST